MAPVMSRSRCRRDLGGCAWDFSEVGRNSTLSDASPIVVLPSSEELRNEIGAYFADFDACVIVSWGLTIN